MSVERILVGEVGRAHGVRGLVRLHAYTADPRDIGRYRLTDATGARAFALTLLPDGLARFDGVADRTAAERLTGTKLYVARADLPPPSDPDEFLLVDLEGLPAFDESGAPFGRVRAVEDHGAGAFLVIDAPRGEVLIPFTKRAVPVVDIAARRVVVAPPEEVLVPPQAGEDAA